MASSVHNSERWALWATTSVLLPLAPLGLSLFFRALGNRPSGPWWWCSEIPFFTIAMAPATYGNINVALQESKGDPAHGPWEAVLPWLRIGCVALVFGAAVLTGAFYADQHVADIGILPRKGIGAMQLVLAVFMFAIGVYGQSRGAK